MGFTVYSNSGNGWVAERCQVTAPVDVLAVMTSTIRTLSIGGVPDEAQQIHKARAAVAELIEADRHYDDAKFGLAHARYNGEPLHTWAKDCAEADIRRAAALARVQGGAK
jgi:hypothetical protein